MHEKGSSKVPENITYINTARKKYLNLPKITPPPLKSSIFVKILILRAERAQKLLLVNDKNKTKKKNLAVAK